MFGLNKYTEKLFEVEWKFDKKKLNDLENLLFVEFQQNDNGNFIIKNILFSYFDILSGLEELDFNFSKTKDKYILEILH